MRQSDRLQRCLRHIEGHSSRQNNARQLESVLKESYKFSDNNITILENPSKQVIERSLSGLRHQVGENGNLLVFFAGHGMWEDDSETGYWIPADAEENEPSTYVHVSAVHNYIRAVHSQHTLLIVDACFSGSIFRTRSGVGDNADPRNTLALYNKKSRKAMTSASLEKVPDKSVFMKYLLQQLRNNPERYVSAGSLFYDIQETVINNTSNGEVVPQYRPIKGAGDEADGEFIFTRTNLPGEIPR